MKHIFLFLFVLVTLSAYSQEFKYEYSDDWVWIYPKEKLYTFEDKTQIMFNFKKDYAETILTEFTNIFDLYLPSEVKKLKNDKKIASLKIYIDNQGRVIPINFMLLKDHLNYFTDGIIRSIYNACLKIRVDISKNTYNVKFTSNNFAVYNVPIG